MTLLSEVVGQGYDKFWNTRKRYVVCKGSRASKKSKTTALWHIVNLMAHSKANALVVRKTERTLRDSCFADLRWAIKRLGVEKHWHAKTSPLELIYKPYRNKILFRGLDDPYKLSSISVDTGHLCFLWLEEASEITRQENFDHLDESIRGQLPDDLWKRVTITLNPWSDRHWIKQRFFDTQDDDTLAMTTTYEINEWLDKADLKLFETMKLNNPRRYRTAGLAEWGISEGLIYENWEERAFDHKQLTNAKPIFGLDFGYVCDETALFCGMIDQSAKGIYVFDELYEKSLSNEKIYERVASMGYAKEKIIADSAEPKSIDRLYELGLKGIRAARKGPDSIMHGIDFIQDYKIIIHPRCVNFLTEINNYTWQEDKTGCKINKPVDDFCHLLDGLRYACEEFSRGATFSFV